MGQDKKIAIMGIDNAGKTSIVTAMQKKFNITEEINGLKPTKQIERNSFQFLNHTIYQEDYGGQRIYRDTYLRLKNRYLVGIDLMVYVIDIQDAARFDESFTYFDQIIKFFKEIMQIVPIVICFHKLDPKLKLDPKIENNIKRLTFKFKEYMNDFEIQINHTNIFQIHTIISAISKGFNAIYTKHEAINEFILDVVNKMENVLALLIFEQNTGLELGSYFLDHLPLAIRKKILTLYEIAQRRILENNMDTYEFSDRLDAFTKVSGVIQAFEIDGLRFFILLVLQEHDEQVVIDQFNFFEQSYVEIYEILQNLLKDDVEQQKQLGEIPR